MQGRGMSQAHYGEAFEDCDGDDEDDADVDEP